MKKDKQERLAGVQGIETYKVILYPLIVAVTVLVSILSVNFDWATIQSATFWFKVTLKILILFAWVYFGVPDGKKIGSKKQAFIEKKNLLQKSACMIKDKGLLLAFRQYVQLWNRESKKEYGENILFSNTIDPSLITRKDKDLKQNYLNYDLDKNQLRILLEVKKGRYYYTQTNAETYLSEFQIVNSQEDAQVHEGKILLKELAPKVILLFVMTFLTTAAIITENASASEAVFEAVSNLTLCITSYGFAIRAGLTIMEKYTRAFEVRDNYIHGFVEKHESGRFVPDLRVYETIEVEEEKPIAKVEAKEAPIKV